MKINTCSKHNSSRAHREARTTRQRIKTGQGDSHALGHKNTARICINYMDTRSRFDLPLAALLTLHLLFTLYSVSLRAQQTTQNLTAVSRRARAFVVLGTPRPRAAACVLLCVLALHLLNLISELTLKFCTLCAQQSLCLLVAGRNYLP